MKKMSSHNTSNLNNHGDDYDIIIVGGGIAGLTSGAYAVKEGYKTLICEKNVELGGLVGSFNRNGFTFDQGIRAFENSGILFPMLKQLGITLEFVNNPVSVGIEDDMIVCKGTAGMAKYERMLISQFPENKIEIKEIINEIKKVISYMDVIYGIDNPLFMDLREDKDYIFKTLLPWLLKYQINIRKAQKLNVPIEAYLYKFSKNQQLIDVIIQHFFKNMPAFFALSYFGLYDDYCYPIGGTGQLIEKMTEFIKIHQGEIALNTEISKIDLLKQQIKIKGGRCFGYQELIWCGDMKALYSSVENEAVQIKTRTRYKNKKLLVNQNHGGDSILTVYIAVNIEPSYFEFITGGHAFYTPSKLGISEIKAEKWQIVMSDKTKNQEQRKQAIILWLEEYLNLTTYEISCPVLRDSTLAPVGKTGLIVSTLMDYALVKGIKEADWYNLFKKKCEEKIVSVLDKTIFQGLEEQIEDIFTSTPLTIESHTGNAEGAITGWAFPSNQGSNNMPAVNEFRKIAKSIETPFYHIYQAGQWTFSPSGLPISVLTGKLAADQAIKSIQKQNRKGRHQEKDGEKL